MPDKKKKTAQNPPTEMQKDEDKDSQKEKTDRTPEEHQKVRKEKKSAAETPKKSDDESRKKSGQEHGEWQKLPFPIVGIGASAGGLEALEAFFENLPEQSDMAFVVITHTDPKHASLLPSILERKTRAAKIKQIEEHMPVELDDGAWDIPELRRLLEETLTRRQAFEDFRVEHRFPKAGLKKMVLNGRRLREDDSRQNKILLAIEDVTERQAECRDRPTPDET